MSDIEELATTIGLVLAKEFSPLDNNWKSEKFTNLSQPSLKYLLCSDDLIVQCENTVFHALMNWMEQNEIDPATTSDLLCVVRFKLMMVDYLYNIVKDHFIASKMPKYDELFLNAMIYHALPVEQKKLFREQPLVGKNPGKISQYTVVVDKQDFEAAHKTGTYESSDVFWTCSYEMSVGLIKVSVNNWQSSYEIFAKLNVHNLKKESLVSLQFSIGRTNRSVSLQKENFTLDSCEKRHSSVTLTQSDFKNDLKCCNVQIAVKPM